MAVPVMIASTTEATWKKLEPQRRGQLSSQVAISSLTVVSSAISWGGGGGGGVVAQPVRMA